MDPAIFGEYQKGSMTVTLTGVAGIFELSAASTLNILRFLTLTTTRAYAAKVFSDSYRTLMEHGIVSLARILNSELSKSG